MFVQKLGPFGLDPFRMLTVDFMHECELGTWKALFLHLIRLLYAIPGGSQLVATLDERYKEFIWTHTVYLLKIANSQSHRRFRQILTFGNGIIRRFSNNTSEMKQLAARDFEDILQVCESCVFYLRIAKMFLVCDSSF